MPNKTAKRHTDSDTILIWVALLVGEAAGGCLVSFGILIGLSEGLDDGFEVGLPEGVALHQNYPNPFNPNTTIKYSLESKQYVKLTVYDLLGKEIAVLADGEFSSGEHSAVFNAKNLSSGIYLYRIQAGNFVATKRMMLVK